MLFLEGLFSCYQFEKLRERWATSQYMLSWSYLWAGTTHLPFPLFWKVIFLSLGWPRTHHVVQGAFKFAATVLSQLPEYWNYRHEPPCPAFPSFKGWGLSKCGLSFRIKLNIEKYFFVGWKETENLFKFNIQNLKYASCHLMKLYCLICPKFLWLLQSSQIVDLHGWLHVY